MKRRHNDYSPAKTSVVSVLLITLLFCMLVSHTHAAAVEEEVEPTPEQIAEIKGWLYPNTGQALIISGEDYDAFIASYCTVVSEQSGGSSFECIRNMRAAFKFAVAYPT